MKQLILAATMCAVSGPAFAQSAAEIAVAHTVAQFCELDVPSEIDMPNLLAGRVFQDGGAMEFAQTIVQMERALTDMPDHAKPLFCEAARIGFPR